MRAMSLRVWRPVLDDEKSKFVLEIVRALGAQFLAPPAEDEPAARLADRALVAAYIGIIQEQQVFRDTAINLVRAASSRLRACHRIGLFGGLAGIGWRLQHVLTILGRLEECDTDRSFDYIDDAIVAALDFETIDPNVDLIAGHAGVGLYLIDRLPARAALRGLELIASSLGRSAVQQDHGVAWLRSASQLTASQRKHFSKGVYDLGVAHGIPGVLFLLAEMIAAGADPPNVRSLLDQGLTWFLQRDVRGQVWSFGSWWADGQQFPSRLAWCYGDLGVARVLEHVATAAGVDSCSNVASRLLQETTCRDRANGGVTDVGICHGALGIAHIYNSAWQATPNRVLELGAKRWYAEALEMLRREVGQSSPESRQELVNRDSSLLSGAGGILLALLASVSTVLPGWDRLLLLSSPYTGSDRSMGKPVVGSNATQAMPCPRVHALPKAQRGKHGRRNL